MKLTSNFTLEELTLSREARVRGLSNTCPPELMDNLKRLAAFLEEIRTLIKVPMYISSGYRSPKVNKLVKGSPTSAHVQALAADFIAPDFGTPYEVAKVISESSLPFDQVIHEYEDWIHIGLASAGKTPRRQPLTIFEPNKYLPGIIKKPTV